MNKRQQTGLAALLSGVCLLGGCGPADTNSEAAVRQLATSAAAGSAEPHLAIGRGQDVVLSWLEPVGDGVALKFSTLELHGWTDAKIVAQGTNWFVNWADFPSVVPIRDDLWAAHWLVRRSGSPYAYDISVSLSEDSGSTWSQPITPHRDGTATEHGFVSLFDAAPGVGMLWLDGRNMDGTYDDDASPETTGMTLRSAVLTGDVSIQQERVADGLVCDCCQTDVALGPNGPIAVYRNRTNDEIRDIYVTRLIDGEWTAGQPVADDGWEIAGCPVNGPAISANGNRVAIAWFTAANDTPKVRFATSDDGAASFGNAIDIALEHPVGRVGVAALNSGHTLVSWLQDGGNGVGDICVAGVSPDGVVGKTHVIASTAAGRISGFPQMIVHGDEVIMAWTDVDGESTNVRSALLQADSLTR
jgi:hypothetical protein